MDWSTLPPELLMKFFTLLKGEGDLEETRSNLGIRLVHPRWKLVMDELLEKWCLEFWTKWKSECFYSCRNLNPYGFPKMIFSADGILCPPFLLGNNSQPFPTKSVCIRSKPGREEMGRINFLNNGSHLTSLSFFEISSVDAFRTNTLASILNSTPNLKALSFQMVGLKLNELIALPSLPNLEHLKVWAVVPQKSPFPFNLVEWLLNPYKSQLVTLETDDMLEWNPHDGLLTYPNLKGLKLWPSSTQLLKAEVAFPSLQYLTLGDVRVGENGPITVQLVQKFVTGFSTTLIELHLDILPHFQHLPRTYAKSRVGMVDDADVAFGPPITNFIFPLLKTFAIFYPKNGEEVEVVKDFLKMFPVLEALTLLIALIVPEQLELTAETVRKHLVEQKYWNLFPTLKSIKVQFSRFGDPVLKMDAPFPITKL